MAVQPAVPSAIQPLSRPDVRRAIPAARRSVDWAEPALVFGAIFSLLILMGPKLLGDPDSHWHPAVGRWIWQEGRVPWTDVFSHTFADRPWIAKEWLSQLIFHGAMAAGGWIGMVLVTAASLALVFSLLFGWLAARCRGTLALALTLLAILFIAPHFLARPHVFALLTFLYWIRGLIEALDEDRAPSAWLLAVMVLWANLHGSFTIGLPIAGLLALEAVLSAPAEKRGETIRNWGVFGLLTLAAGCATPYGVHALVVTFTIFGSGESLPFITEWQPIGWTFAGLLSCALALALAGALAADGWRNAARIALIGGLIAMTIRHGRFIDLFALAAPLVAAVPLARRFPDLRPEPIDPASRWPLVVRGMLIASLAGALLALAWHRPAPAASVTPSAALAAARAAGVTGPVYNSYDFGGFLIAEGVPTFIDGRTDQLFLGGFISGLHAVADASQSGPFLDFVARYGVTWALVQAGSPELRHFEAAPGWALIHRDATASVYTRMLRGSLR